MALSFEEQFGAVNAANQFERLVHLDQLWTNYLQDVKEIHERDIILLTRLTDEMSNLLRAAPDRAGYLEHVVADNQGYFERYYEQINQWEILSNSGRERLGQLVRRHGGVVEYCRNGLRFIGERSNGELEQLTAKMERIRGGGFTPGDLSPQFICNLACGCIAGGIAAPPPANAVAIGAGLAMLLFLQSKGEDC